MYNPTSQVHGWDYRRYLLSQIALSSLPDGTSKDTATSIPPFPFSLSHPPIPSQVKAHHLSLANSELAYTLRKIESNFSNFSAWHWRSKLFPEIWAAQQLTKTQIAQARDQELELLRQAMYTDPADQSVWLYHTWLVDIDPSQDVLQREITSIEELLEVEPDSKCKFLLLLIHTAFVFIFNSYSPLAFILQGASKVSPATRLNWPKNT